MTGTDPTIRTETQVAVRDTVRAFAQERVKPNAFAFEQARSCPPQLFRDMAELGLMGMIAPEDHGGAGLDSVSYALALIELAAGDGALSTLVSIHNSLIVTALLKYGTAAQRERFLPMLVSGQGTGAFALTETDAGSDASAMRTRAVRADGGWRITGPSSSSPAGVSPGWRSSSR
jgi:alkylation response protein AidB-like acyl-CoA dehydrogenase